MPITSSAKKALRASKTKRVYNLRIKANVDSSIKELKKLVVKKDKVGAMKLMPAVYKALDKAAKKNYIKDNNASRLKSRISAMVKKIA
ncbi:MAG: 30S ribosomal protein S20 [Patescibacteria group bacterium]|nr:30S ribosomal protein S20 [Patescibacteria group bacterium]